jgi:transposase-like protein
MRSSRPVPGNMRNGTWAKTVLAEASGQVPIEVLRGRQGAFEPQIIKKRQRRLAGSMSTGTVQAAR